MAAEDTDTPPGGPPAGSPSGDPVCHACRGRGRVLSSLGGEQHLVTCPWCEGSGSFILGHDAQAARRERRGGEDSRAD